MDTACENCHRSYWQHCLRPPMLYSKTIVNLADICSPCATNEPAKRRRHDHCDSQEQSAATEGVLMPTVELPRGSSVDTSTSYMGLRLRHPFMAGASPFSAHLDGVRTLEDAGASAIVLHSLFEEQITEAQSGRIHGMGGDDPAFIEPLAAFPRAAEYPFAPDQHLDLGKSGRSPLPVIASLNGTSSEAWLVRASDAGCWRSVMNYGVMISRVLARDCLEHCQYSCQSETRSEDSGLDCCRRAHALGILAPPRQAGADRLVIFNRFYQPDIDIRTLTLPVARYRGARGCCSACDGCDSSRSHPSVARCHRRRRNVE